MITKLKELEQVIHNAVKGFDSSFHYVFKEPKNGYLMAYNDNELESVFPEDRIGNYFFFWVNDEIKFNVGQSVTTTKKEYIDTVNFSMIFSISGYNTVNLLSAIRSAIAMSNLGVKMLGADLNGYSVIGKLLRGYKEKDVIERTLNRYSGENQIFEIKCSLNSIFVPNICEINLCKDCE